MKKLLLLASIVALVGCETTPPPRKPYHVDAFAPKNPANVRIKVSLQNRAVYVMEGDNPLMVTATAIGRPETPTPTGHFRVGARIPNKRSGSYGFWTNGVNVVDGRSSQSPAPGYRYVGFPMQWWIGLDRAPAYGFHVGSVWPTPRTHGCLRLHQNVAHKFFELARPGTPIYIAESLPEDLTIGRNIPRPTDYNDPDLPARVLMSDEAFPRPTTGLLPNPF